MELDNKKPFLQEGRPPEAFITATRNTFDGLQLERVIQNIEYIPSDQNVKGELAAVMPVTGALEGCVILSMGKETSLGLAQQMLGGGDVENEILDSVVLELVNIIIGRSQIHLEKSRISFEFSTPSLIKGLGISAPIDVQNCYSLDSVDFELASGDHFFMQFYFQK